MKTLKLILTLIVLVIAAYLALKLVGVVITVVTYLVIFGALALLGLLAVKMLSGAKKADQLEGRRTGGALDDPLDAATRQIEEIKRKYLSK